ncbi:MAG: HAMP domain-containing histidine kinase [Bacteroidaceae bacterium]|nr:HAMP domain-containing histidine kinase [Bacteroidaceae bacterium]
MALSSRHYTWNVVVTVLLVTTMPAVTVLLVMSASRTETMGAKTLITSVGAIAAVVIAIISIIKLIRLIRYPVNQTELMARAVVNKDFMLHIPKTDDLLLGRASQDMNRILDTYRKDQNELETRKNYYDRILRVMTHELRNTVTPIVSLTDWMVSNPDAQSEEERQEAIEIINTQAHNVCNFLESYRQLTVLEKPDMADIPATTLFRNIQTLIKAERGAGRVRFETAGDVVLHVDSGLLSLALINIIRNAIQATEGVEDGQVTVLASMPGGKPLITVTNNGPEIPQAIIEQIFMPFYSTKKKQSGSGIGLALSRQIMQLHEGTLTCSSHYPFTTFTFQFK